jgi:hypothetical protein
MPNIIITESFTITAGGGTELISTGSTIDRIVIVPDAGAVTLAANQIFAVVGTPTQGLTYTFEYNGGVTLDGNTLDIFGFQLSAAEALAKYIITATFLDGIFQVKLAFSANDGAPTIDGSQIQAETITSTSLVTGGIALTDLVPLSGEGLQLKSDVSGVLIEHDATGSGQITVGNTTTVNAVNMSGAITMDFAGTTTLGIGVVTEQNLAFTIDSDLSATLLIPSASILNWNANPIQLVSAPGVGFYIELVSASAFMNFQSIFYIGSTTTTLFINGATNTISSSQILESTIDRGVTFKFLDATLLSTETIYLENQPLMIGNTVGAPANGDSDITVSVTYKIRQI